MPCRSGRGSRTQKAACDSWVGTDTPAGPIDFAHATDAQQRDDLIGAYATTGGERQLGGFYGAGNGREHDAGRTSSSRRPTIRSPPGGASRTCQDAGRFELCAAGRLNRIVWFEEGMNCAQTAPTSCRHMTVRLAGVMGPHARLGTEGKGVRRRTLTSIEREHDSITLSDRLLDPLPIRDRDPRGLAREPASASSRDACRLAGPAGHGLWQ